MVEKKENFESKKQSIKDLLNNMAEQISNKEQKSGNFTEIDESLQKLYSEIDWVKTEEQLKDFLSDVKDELDSLKLNTEYKEYKDMLDDLENELEILQKDEIENFKKQIAQVQKNIADAKKLTPKQLIEKAKEGRQKASDSIEKWIVAKLAQRNDWIGKLAKKAMW